MLARTYAATVNSSRDDYLRRITDVTVAVLKASRGATWPGAAANTADVKSVP